MSTEKVNFTEVRETNLITLYGRALQSQSQNPVLPDKWAEDAVARIDYDFAKLKVKSNEALSIVIRARQFDLWTAHYLAVHPDAAVVHLGCGLDSRVFRVDPPATALWFDVDYPDVIDLRRRLYSERAGYTMIGASLAGLHWLDQVPGDRPAMMVAEGVMMYLTEDVVKPLVRGLSEHFSAGQMAFDVFSRLGLRMARSRPTIKGTGATFNWGIDNPQDIKTFAPRLDIVTELRLPDMADFSRLPQSLQILVRAMDLVPALARLNRLLLYKF